MTPKIRPSYLRLVRPAIVKEAIHVADVIASVQKLTGVGADRFLGADLDRDATYARHLTVFLLRSRRQMTYRNMAILFNRDHSSLVDGYRRIDLERLIRVETAADVAALQAELA